MIKRLLSFIFLLSTVHFGFANKTDSIAGNIFTLIYQHDLQAAEKLLAAEKTELDEFYYLLLNLDLHWWKYRIIDTKKDAQVIDALIESLDSDKAQNNWQKIQQLLVKSYKLRYDKTRLSFISMLSTRSDMKELVDQIKLDELPLKGEELKLFEAYVIMFQYIEDINFIGGQDNSDERKKLLDRMEEFAAEDNIMLSTVARFFLARMYQKVEKEPETGLSHYKVLTRQFPTNKTFATYRKECEEKI